MKRYLMLLCLLGSSLYGYHLTIENKLGSSHKVTICWALCGCEDYTVGPNSKIEKKYSGGCCINYIHVHGIKEFDKPLSNYTYARVGGQGKAFNNVAQVTTGIDTICRAIKIILFEQGGKPRVRFESL